MCILNLWLENFEMVKLDDTNKSWLSVIEADLDNKLWHMYSTLRHWNITWASALIVKPDWVMSHGENPQINTWKNIFYSFITVIVVLF